MRRTLKDKQSPCSYCGRPRELTADHIPPRNLFCKPRPGNLITVPACADCNAGFSRDDEYFRLAITTGVDPGRFPQATGAIEKLSDPHKIGLAKTMLENFNRREVFGPGGAYLGRAGILTIDGSRIKRVTSRIVRGLFSYHRGYPLPEAYEVKIWSDWFDPQCAADENCRCAVAEVMAFLSGQELHDIGDGVFRYRFASERLDSHESACWFTFFDHQAFIGTTTQGEPCATCPGETHHDT